MNYKIIIFPPPPPFTFGQFQASFIFTPFQSEAYLQRHIISQNEKVS